MKLPIRNYQSIPLTLFIEPFCEEYEIPVGGEAQVTLADGQPHSIDIHPNQFIVVWDEGVEGAVVRVFDEHQFSQKK